MRKPCETCIHSLFVPQAGMHCGRSGGGYHCDDERSLGFLGAVLYGACGAQGRFHVAREGAQAAPPMRRQLAIDS